MGKDENQLAEFNKLLDKFKKFPPKPVYEPTYLELCKYPWNRLEEICSRLFAFFFDTRNPHGVGTLFFDTLLEVYQEKYSAEIENFDKKNILYTRSVFAETEKYTENGNRIDLLLTTDCLKVCIENKIDAPPDNDFQDYYNYVKKESESLNLHTMCILLALCEKAEYKDVNPNFKTIYYREFLEKLKRNLGAYVIQCNSKYLSYLTDFILFLDRKGGCMSDFTAEEKDFFLNDENNRILDSLITRRNQFQEEQKNEKNQHIDIIKKLLAEKENINLEIGDWRGWHYLRDCFEKNNSKYELGIEAGFADGLFNISLTIWQLDGQKQRIDLYESLIEKYFNNPRKTHEPPKDKWCVIVKSIDGNDDKQIVGGLCDVYKKTEKIVNEAKNPK